MNQDIDTTPKEEPPFWNRGNIKYLLRWAFGGFIGTILGLVGAGLILEFVIDWSVGLSGGRGAALIILVGVMAAFLGYPLVGAVVGVLLGIRKLKHDRPKGNINENNRGLVAGLITGTVFYPLMILVAAISSLFAP